MDKLSKLIESFTGFIESIDGRIRLWGALLILVFSLVVLLLFNNEIPFNEWYVYLFFLVVILIALASIIDMIGPGNSKNVRSLLKINKAISGVWGEIMLNHDYIAFSRLIIRYNPTLLQFELSGEAYDTKGEEVANWKSQATALTSFSPVKIFYFWKGKRFKGYKETGGPKAQGAGVLDFTSDFDGNINAGMGYYVSEIEDEIQKNIRGKRYETKIRRLNTQEINLIKTEKGRIEFIKNHL
jgi:hypothetical protein